jgi:dihydrofolate reductase
MSKMLLDMAVSLDGFVTDANGGDGGLHNYFFAPSGETTKIIEEGFRITGAIIMGRRSYETGVEQGGYADNPYQVPTFVLSHSVPEKKAPGAESFVFVTDGIESAAAQARAAAGDRYAVIGGGADIAQQCLKAGLVDEIQLHLIPVIFGSGLPLFDHLSQIKLEQVRVVQGSGVTHIKYCVVK